MRLELELIADETKKMNINYNYHISAAIYNLLSQHDQSFSAMLHNEGYKLGNKKFKLFVFSRFMPASYRIEGEHMIINPGICRLFINSPVSRFIECIGNSLIKNGIVKIGGDEYRVVNVYVKDKAVFDYETEFLTLSPIVVTTGREVDGKIKPRTVYIHEKKFTENIKNNLMKKYFLVHGRLPDNMSIDIQFDEEYIKAKPRGVLIRFKNVNIKGFIAPFKMKCSDDIKKIAIDCGLGENNSIGMGYILERERR